MPQRRVISRLNFTSGPHTRRKSSRSLGVTRQPYKFWCARTVARSHCCYWFRAGRSAQLAPPSQQRVKPYCIEPHSTAHGVKSEVTLWTPKQAPNSHQTNRAKKNARRKATLPGGACATRSTGWRSDYRPQEAGDQDQTSTWRRKSWTK